MIAMGMFGRTRKKKFTMHVMTPSGNCKRLLLDTDEVASDLHKHVDSDGNLYCTETIENGEKILNIISKHKFDELVPMMRQLDRRLDELFPTPTAEEVRQEIEARMAALQAIDELDEQELMRLIELRMVEIDDEFVKIYRLSWLGGFSTTISKRGEKTHIWNEEKELNNKIVYMVEMVGNDGHYYSLTNRDNFRKLLKERNEESLGAKAR
jgi:hypothetical protein